MFSEMLSCLRKANTLPTLALKQQKPPQSSAAALSPAPKTVLKKLTTDGAKPHLPCRNYSNKMNGHCVVPDLIPLAPKEICTVEYPKGAKVEEGNILKPTQVQEPPTVKWNCEDCAFYTLYMTDLDVPSRTQPSMREWQNWLVGNIPGCDVAKGQVMSAYIGAGPAQGSGLHRYVFLVYKQDGQIQFKETLSTGNSAKGRACFEITEFAYKYDLGHPIAGNFFQAEWDECVRKLYKQLGMK